MIQLPRPALQYDPMAQAQLQRSIEDALTRLDTKIEDVRVKPRVEILTLSFNEAGQAFVVLQCNPDTLSFRYVIQEDVAPTLEEVQLADPTPGSTASLTYAGTLAAGTVLHVGVIPYSGPSGDGRNGELVSTSAARTGSSYNECRAVVIASTDLTLTVQVYALSDAGKVAVALDSLTGAATIASGLALGVPGIAPQTWVFNRPVATSGDTVARFTATFPDAVDDSDILIIPEQGVSPLIFLTSRARVLELTPTEMTVRFAVVDPLPQGANTVNATVAASGCVIVPSTLQTLTPDAVYSGVADSFQDYVITRPLGGAANGEVVFTAASNAGYRVSDRDVILVPARDQVPAWLRVDVTPGDEEYVLDWTGGTNLYLKINDRDESSITSAGTVTVLRGAASGGEDKTYVFRAEGALDTQVTVPAFIPKKPAPVAGLPEITSITVDGGVFNCDGSGSFDVSWSETAMPGGQTYTIEWRVVAGFTISAESGTVDPATNPDTISAYLCDSIDAPRVEVTVRAYSGASLIAERTLETDVAF